MKILHCSDVHLDAKMETGLTPARARERRVELLLTFSRMVDAAAAAGVQAILLAGDLFDTARVSEKTRRYVGDVVEQHPGLRFLSVAGNHDETVAPLFSSVTPPENWIAFPADAWGSVQLGENIVVSGTSNLDRAGVWEELPTAAPGEFHIVLLHGQVVRTGEGGGETIPLRRLQNRGIDYLALGHEHTHTKEALDARGDWVYAGCLEGRGFDECGEKGYVLLDTASDRVTRVTFHPIAKRTLHRVPVDLSGTESYGEVEARLLAAITGIPEGDMVKAVLTGEISPELCYDTVHLKSILDERFYFSRVADETRLRLDPAAYATDVSLKGEFIRTVLASRISEEDKQRTILCGLRALRGEEVDA